VPGVTRPFRYNELIVGQGGLSALHFAARDGRRQTTRALVEAGSDVNLPSPADRSTPLLVAVINGHFDLALDLLERGADPGPANRAGVTPLYAAINVQWAPKAAYPQPRAHLQQHHTYLDVVTALLERGVDPNPRLNRKVWFASYNFDQSNVDETGATPLWRAAYAADVDAIKVLVAHGADPNITTIRVPERRDPDNPDGARDVSGLPPVSIGGPAITPLHAAAGPGYAKGFAGNSHHVAPGGMLATVKYLVDDLHADVNARDAEGNTALHHAAARGDNAMILYLVSKGADVKAVNRAGQTTVDVANGPVQRVQPYPETITLLEGLGARNNHRCVSC
jgi:ankyrin repeat protein